MKTRATLFVVFTLVLFAFGVLITTLFNTAPTTKDAVMLFYASGFVFLFGLIFFTTYAFNYIRLQGNPGPLSIRTSLRASLVADIYLLALLALSASGVLGWATGIVLTVGGVILTIVLRKKAV